jgi:hypothetical protein
MGLEIMVSNETTQVVGNYWFFRQFVQSGVLTFGAPQRKQKTDLRLEQLRNLWSVDPQLKHFAILGRLLL